MPEEIWKFPKIGSKKQRSFYVPESMQHPAKMDVALTRKLIKEFVPKNATILDPMAGVGTTAVEGILLGRNVIAVDIEKKFTRLTKKNVDNVQKRNKQSRFQLPLGKAVVITGDSRDLKQLLQDHADSIITSPPFAEANRGGGIAQKGYEGKHGKDKKLHLRQDRPLSDNPGNISNLSHTENVDTVLTSPPFSEAEHNYDHGLKNLGKNFRGRKAWENKEQASLSQGNVGKLKHGSIKGADTIVTSPPYPEAYKNQGKSRAAIADQKASKGIFMTDPDGGGQKSMFTSPTNIAAQGFVEGLPGNPQNIGNLSYHTGKGVDAVITSPPYANIHQCPANSAPMTEFFIQQLKEKGFIEWQGRRYSEAEWRAMNHGRIDGRSTKGVKKDAIYSNNPENIGNLQHGKVDTVITSPPYAASLEGGTKHHRANGSPYKIAEEKKIESSYSDDKQNIGNLKHDGVDVVLTSPPFGQSVSKHAGGDKVRERFEGFMGDSQIAARKYSEDERNIGNLPEHGKVDVIVTSPPFDNRQPRVHTPHLLTKEKDMDSIKELKPGYSQNPDNIGNLSQHGSVDVVLTSPPYSEGIGHSLGANIGKKIPEAIRQTRSFKSKVALGLKHELIKHASQGNIGSISDHGSIKKVVGEGESRQKRK